MDMDMDMELPPSATRRKDSIGRWVECEHSVSFLFTLRLWIMLTHLSLCSHRARTSLRLLRRQGYRTTVRLASRHPGTSHLRTPRIPRRYSLILIRVRFSYYEEEKALGDRNYVYLLLFVPFPCIGKALQVFFALSYPITTTKLVRVRVPPQEEHEREHGVYVRGS
jgi:hypothetical protein